MRFYMSVWPRFIVLLSLICSFAIGSGAQDPREQAWTILKAGLSNTNTEKRSKAVSDLALLPGDPQAIEAAIAALKDEKPEVRTAAAQALGDMGAKQAREQLVAMADDEDPAPIFAAGHALLQLGDDRGYEFSTQCSPANARAVKV
jgi:HEAT repeat protein